MDRIGVDLERLGKRERQRDPAAWVSPHRETDLARVAGVVRRAAVFARLDPLHDGTAAQVERVLALGATVLMLPMVGCRDDVATLQSLAGARASIVPLLETPSGLAVVADLPALGVREAYVGINDLALSWGAPNRFWVLAGDELAAAAQVARRVGVALGIGGLARAGDDDLPVPSPWSAQHARLGSTGLLSRSFFAGRPSTPGPRCGGRVRRSRHGAPHRRVLRDAQARLAGGRPRWRRVRAPEACLCASCGG